LGFEVAQEYLKGHNFWMLRYTQLILWRIFAVLALMLGLIGVVLPIVPTAPFLILAAWAAGRGSPRLEQWLLNHPRYGSHIRAWRERGVVPRRAKVFAVLMMSVSAIVLQFTAVVLLARLVVPAVMVAVAIWLCTRPER
jgi:uncharacterized membrane protein YbaN (DUF454 family)